MASNEGEIRIVWFEPTSLLLAPSTVQRFAPEGPLLTDMVLLPANRPLFLGSKPSQPLLASADHNCSRLTTLAFPVPEQPQYPEGLVLNRNWHAFSKEFVEVQVDLKRAKAREYPADGSVGSHSGPKQS